jgi:single-stranded-DNA-specific exonuclease
MMKEAELKPGEVDAGRIGFVLGPRLNAAGRMADAIASYNLLMASSVEEAAELAMQLALQNRKRQQQMNEMIEHAREQIRALGDELIYVLASREYTAGIAGLVASRIKDEFYRPTLVIALEEADGKSKGSARSIEAFNIASALDECDGLLEKHGGHAAAAGFTICNDQIDQFRSCLDAIAARHLTPDDPLSEG